MNEDVILFRRLIEVIERLRGEDGCPWDKAQTLKSIRENIMEEALEVVEAIEEDDASHLKEELGDLLFLVLFATKIAEDENLFTYEDVIESAINKLIYRHPHVFGQQKAKDKDEALSIWKKQKEISDPSGNKKIKRLSFYSIMLRLSEILPKLKEEKFDIIVGIKRGGIIPSSMLSYKLGLPLNFIEVRLYEDGPMPKRLYEKPVIIDNSLNENIENRRILLVDDVENTGDTMKSVRKILDEKSSYIRTFSIVGKHTDYYLFYKERCLKLPWI